MTSTMSELPRQDAPRSASSSRSLRALLLPGLLTFSSMALAAADCRQLEQAGELADGALESIPASAARAPEGATRIGDLRVIRQPIFNLDDPKEDRPLYRLANRLHIETLEQTVHEHLTVEAGDPLDAAALQESERILRNLDWLYDARVVPVRQCGEAVDVAVLVRDVWSIVPTGDVDRSGGESSFAFGVKDVNLLGRGETLGMFYQDGVDRDGVAAFYEDPALGATDWTLSLFGADFDDGGRLALNLEEPFRSLDDPSSRGFSAEVDERVQPLYDTGFRVAEFGQRSTRARTFLAGSSGRVEGRVRRWQLGLAHFDHEFRREPGSLQPARLPEDRSATWPFLGFELIEDDWGAGRNLDLIEHAEDIHLGQRLAASIGVSPDALGADDGRILFSAAWSDAARPGTDWLVSWAGSADGAVTTSDGDAENLVVSAGTRVYYRQSRAFSVFGSVEGTWTRGLTRDRQLLLGGGTGLRGYPQRFQDGDRRLRVRLEQRWFSGAHPFQLFRFGAAVFLDGGRAWFPGDPDDDDETGWLANAGIGLRFSSTRIPTNSMFHLDLAMPLRTGGRDVEDLQLSLTMRETF
jgi:hypothetical protein